MMPVKRIRSRANADFRYLRDLARDGRMRRSMGEVLLDGEHLIESALTANVPLRRLILAESCRRSEAWLRRCPQTPVILLADALMREVSPLVTPAGVMAIVAPPAVSRAEANQVLLLENVQDPGNLGALLRTAAAAGVDLVCLSSGCAEAWSPKALRGAQGAQFILAIREQVDLLAFTDTFPGEVWAAVPAQGPSLYAIELCLPFAFAFGNEGSGLSPELCARARPFHIPMAAGVESMNVAAAAAVTLFEARRRALAAR